MQGLESVLSDLQNHDKLKAQSEVQKALYMEAKTRVQAIIDSFKKIEKKCKKTKQSRKIMKLMEDFVKCNLSSPSIESKYQAVYEELKKYYVSKGQTVSGA